MWVRRARLPAKASFPLRQERWLQPAAFCALDIAAAAAKTRSAWREWVSKTFPKFV